MTFAQTISGTPYYVNCNTGNDANSGTAQDQAWKSIEKANTAVLNPGDQLLLKRGCTWTTRLDARWSGTAGKPILIGAYGNGELPKIQNGLHGNVRITGSYLIVENVQVHYDQLPVDPNCQNQPVGYVIGFHFMDGAAHNVLRNSKASGHTAGARIAFEAHHNQILHNTFVNNNVLESMNAEPPDSELGAWGILVNGNHNEIAYNYLADNNARCSYSVKLSGNSIELYAAQGNTIHHNMAINDRVFSELGGSATRQAADNVFAYNVHASSAPYARFLVVRGGKNKWGPTERTKVYNNTVYLTGPFSQGVVCGGGCSGEILTLKNNIVWATEKAAFADAPFDEGHNIYWETNGSPKVEFMSFAPSSTSLMADPQFVNPDGLDFHLQATSPAIDHGSLESVEAGFTTDLDQVAVPQNAGVDSGAFESGGVPQPIFLPLIRR